MNLKPDTYVPSLRWRCGEYQALYRLKESAKSQIVPFVVVPEIEFDFEEWRPKKTVQEHVAPFATRYHQKWGGRPAWVDVHPKIISARMDDGKLPIAHIFDELRIKGSAAVPVTSLDASTDINTTIAEIVKKDGRGLGVRARLEHIMNIGFGASLATLIKSMKVGATQADLIIDLGAPNYEPYEDFADALLGAIENIGDVSQFRSFVLCGSGFPESIALDKPGGQLPRHDWEFFKVLKAKLKGIGRVPNYGDYTIVHPEFTPRDMRKIKSGGRVVYTSQGCWIVRKGGAFRDNPEQMHDHCKHIVTSGQFRGAEFSYGDDYIEKCAKHLEGPSNQPFWKQVAISHHIMHVLEDIAKSDASA